MGFKTRDFLSDPDLRYFRLEPALLNCLQAAEDRLVLLSNHTGISLRVLTGYKTRERDLQDKNSTGATFNETLFRSGRAIEVQNTLGADLNRTLEALWALVDTCSAVAHEKQATIGVALYADRVYIDLRLGDSPTVWVHPEIPVNSSEVAVEVERRVRLAPGLIQPLNIDRACRVPPPVRQRGDYTYQTYTATSGRDPNRRRRTLLGCSDAPEVTPHCNATALHRQRAVEEIWTAAELAAQTKGWPRLPFDVRTALEGCVLPCDPCDSGTTYQDKVRLCSEFVHWAPLGFGSGKRTALYVLDNPETQQLACHGDRSCVMGTGLFGTVFGAMDKTYQPDPSLPAEEHVFGPENPSPVNALMHELFALHAQGEVDVFLTDGGEVGALAPVFKNIMVSFFRSLVP
jgi:hypothetical protein